MVRKKWKRKSGWISPTSTLKISKDEIINESLEPRLFYDDWCNFRDGQRINRDRTRLRDPNCYMARFTDVGKENKKIKKLVERRKIRQKSFRNC